LNCDGLIGAAAPCDYRPRRVAENKISKTGEPLLLELVETPDIVATLALEKTAHQWVVGFALETEDPRIRAIAKLERKSCDLIVSNGPEAMNALENQVEVINRAGKVLESLAGDKQFVARGILRVIQATLIEGKPPESR
jgi:phosphopantothenoylcysteine decarboxylase/phosphopantothenate--cysteine ligase